MERKVLGILSIVFGGLGLLLSWVPIINNFAFVLGILALILGIIALIVNRKNKKILAIIGTAISVVTIAIVLFTQASYSHAINKVSEDIKTTSNSSKKDPKVYAINETVKHNGINYKVNSVDFKEGTGFSKTENGEKYVVANITMTNNGKSDFDYNPVDFKLSIDGNEPNEITVAPDGVDTFNSGTLKPGATMTGNLVLGKLNVDNVKELIMVHHDNNSIKSADYTFSVKLK